MSDVLLRLHLLIRPTSASHIAETACGLRGDLHNQPEPWLATSYSQSWITTDPAKVTCKRCLKQMAKKP